MFFKLALIALPMIVAFDLLWLGVFAKSFYAKQLGFLMAKSVVWPAAILFYLIFTIGLTVFVTLPASQGKNMMAPIIMGALFGLVTYATYDLTNHATVKNWPMWVTIIDLLWGMTMTATVSSLTLLIARSLR